MDPKTIDMVFLGIHTLVQPPSQTIEIILQKLTWVKLFQTTITGHNKIDQVQHTHRGDDNAINTLKYTDDKAMLNLMSKFRKSASYKNTAR